MRWTFPGELRVSEARPRDALALLALHRDVLHERDWFITLPHELSVGLDQKSELIREMQLSPNSVMLVARLPDAPVAGVLTIVGGMLARMRHTGKLEIMVQPSLRGRGVGRALMEAGLRWACDNEALIKVGLSVFATNTRALALYRGFGFEEEGRRPREYRLEDGTYRDDVLLYRFVDGPYAEGQQGARS